MTWICHRADPGPLTLSRSAHASSLAILTSLRSGWCTSRDIIGYCLYFDSLGLDHSILKQPHRIDKAANLEWSQLERVWSNPDGAFLGGYCRDAGAALPSNRICRKYRWGPFRSRQTNLHSLCLLTLRYFEATTRRSGALLALLGDDTVGLDGCSRTWYRRWDSWRGYYCVFTLMVARVGSAL